jgi:hypothetical protein
MVKYYLLYLVCLFLVCCKEGAKESTDPPTNGKIQNEIPLNSYSEDAPDNDAYEDGDYCATIDYYNPDSGTSSTYTLVVEIEGGELVQINWPNGGWLDNSHFSPPEVDEDGSCKFSTYDGKEYEVQISGEGNCITSNDFPESDDEEIGAEETGEEIEFEPNGEQTSLRPRSRNNLPWQWTSRSFGIPNMFIVNDGKIDWIGHPRDAYSILSQILKKTWRPDLH